MELNQVIYGDALEKLREMPSEYADCCVTSPPYYWKKDYKVDGQIGMESSLDAYLVKLRDVFREVWRVLHREGTLWLNIGDSYSPLGGSKITTEQKGQWARWSEWKNTSSVRTKPAENTFGPKQRLLVPFRLAILLQEDGWIVRSSIIWSKNRTMPESVKDRPTMAHEHVFLLTKQENYRYYYDAVKQPCSPTTIERYKRPYNAQEYRGHINDRKNNLNRYVNTGKASEAAEHGRNLWDVWHMATAGTKGHHFAPFPDQLVETCILAGSKEGHVMLDPFLGTGTTARVAESLGRHWVGIELNRDYEPLIKDSTKQQGLFTSSP